MGEVVLAGQQREGENPNHLLRNPNADIEQWIHLDQFLSF